MRRRLLPILGLVAIALVTALAIVGVAVYASEDDTTATAVIPEDVGPGEEGLPGSGLPVEGIEARGSVEPRNILFGDVIRARVDGGSIPIPSV